MKNLLKARVLPSCCSTIICCCCLTVVDLSSGCGGVAALNFGEAELQAWSVTIWRVFLQPAPIELQDCTVQYTALANLLKKQSEQVNILILQNKRIEELLLAVETPKATSDVSVAAQTAIRYEWFTAEPRVYASGSVMKTSLYEFRRVPGHMMLFLPPGVKLDA
ncbi:Hypothetical protein PHPALM_114 [Phytophthora palmivora]|uniref:Uncharacterized protein n=1 Tax=Phytophthora palmivora TaxID=4796 RepID=A0A2P4YVS8_9STRA|nr:Hypothetical protein PHPALM_114 [Phytophthora palmivora]